MGVYAYCDRCGVIEFADCVDDIPTGMLVFATGGDDLKAKVETKARHGYDSDTLLVPGVPEASTDEEAMSAFQRWHEWAFPKELAAIHMPGKAGA
ncbi:hypothetical protein [Martelella radicis]|uniref:Uncharacterized protein n=1 Tax=Martelella radicis TaxID=1397476 RepID=A0A7W6KKE0_9HYPH|nr:hypothetical protein [Martelella radicis]MBB4122943.1 hypothetical protein [Martelella radicis]